MTDNLLIDMPEIRLPRDMARRVRFVDAVEEHARRLGIAGRFSPPRFFGYYFSGPRPVVVAGQWTVMLDEIPLLAQLKLMVERLTDGQFSIAGRDPAGEPAFILVHDRHDGSCWLWDYEHGRRFLEAHEPFTEGNWDGDDELLDPPGPKLLGP